MTWGPLFMYYHCPDCGKKFKYELDMIGRLADRFGRCPECGAEGIFVKESPRRAGDEAYEEIDELGGIYD